MVVLVKNLPIDAGEIRDVGSIPGLGGSLEEGMVTILVFLLENPMDRGAWRAMVHGVSKELDMTEPLSMQAFILRNGLGVTFLF